MAWALDLETTAHLGPISPPGNVDWSLWTHQDKIWLESVTDCVVSYRVRRQWGTEKMVTVVGPADNLTWALNKAIEILRGRGGPPPPPPPPPPAQTMGIPWMPPWMPWVPPPQWQWPAADSLHLLPYLYGPAAARPAPSTHEEPDVEDEPAAERLAPQPPREPPPAKLTKAPKSKKTEVELVDSSADRSRTPPRKRSGV